LSWIVFFEAFLLGGLLLTGASVPLFALALIVFELAFVFLRISEVFPLEILFFALVFVFVNFMT
jgi:hypothetical protein